MINEIRRQLLCGFRKFFSGIQVIFLMLSQKFQRKRFYFIEHVDKVLFNN